MTKVTDAQKSATMILFDDVQVEKRLPFKPDPAIGNLCIGTLDSIELREQTTEKFDENGMDKGYEFGGIPIPVIIYTFKQKPTKDDPNERFVTQVHKPVVSVNKEGEPVKHDDVVNLITQQYQNMKHIANAFSKQKGYPAKLDSCPGIDPKANPIDRATQFKDFYEYFIKIMNGTEKEPIYKDVLCFIKVVADASKGTFLRIPKYVGTGFIEVVKGNTMPSISLSPSETVVLKAGANTTKTAAESQVASGEPVAAADTNVPTEVQSILDKYK